VKAALRAHSADADVEKRERGAFAGYSIRCLAMMSRLKLTTDAQM